MSQTPERYYQHLEDLESQKLDPRILKEMKRMNFQDLYSLSEQNNHQQTPARWYAVFLRGFTVNILIRCSGDSRTWKDYIVLPDLYFLFSG